MGPLQRDLNGEFGMLDGAGMVKVGISLDSGYRVTSVSEDLSTDLGRNLPKDTVARTKRSSKA